MIINNKHTKTTMLIITLLTSVCMLTTSLTTGTIAYGAEAPAGDENFNYNGYSATQLKNISECISGVIPASKCPSYEASSKDYYAGTVNHANMPTPGSIINTKIGWRKWADAAMKANSYDGVYGTLKIASGGATGATSSSTGNEVSDVRLRLIGINQDNRADGTGKAGLTFQAIGYYNIKSSANINAIGGTTAGGWRDTSMRKNLNYESNGTILNAIQSADFKNSITPVLKISDNRGNDNGDNYTSNLSSTTIDKLWILSPSEIGMSIINNYEDSYYDYHRAGANIHYYGSDSYKNTIKSSIDGSNNNYWSAFYNYLYAGNAYQWWMLPAGSRKMSNGSQAYHNTDSYSYCALFTSSNPSSNKECVYNNSYWLRSAAPRGEWTSYSRYSGAGGGSIGDRPANETNGIVVSFSF